MEIIHGNPIGWMVMETNKVSDPCPKFVKQNTVFFFN